MINRLPMLLEHISLYIYILFVEKTVSVFKQKLKQIMFISGNNFYSIIKIIELNIGYVDREPSAIF